MAILWDSEPVSSGDKILQVIDANKFSYTKVGSSGVKRIKFHEIRRLRVASRTIVLFNLKL